LFKSSLSAKAVSQLKQARLSTSAPQTPKEQIRTENGENEFIYRKAMFCGMAEVNHSKKYNDALLSGRCF